MRLAQPSEQPIPHAAPLTGESLAVAVRTLTSGDHTLAALVRVYGPPPLWDRAPGFATLAQVILEQQVSLASAATVFARINATLPGGISPHSILSAGTEGLQRLGLTRQKARYLFVLAESAHDGRLPLSALEDLDDRDASALLIQFPGIGPWTSSIYLLMALRRPDIWPSGDLALHRMIELLSGSSVRLPRETVDAAAERWRPWRAVAARILWQSYLGGHLSSLSNFPPMPLTKS